MNPKTEGILESSLYVNDLARSARFYEKIFGFEVISDFGERGCAMKAGMRQVLLLFREQEPGATTQKTNPERVPSRLPYDEGIWPNWCLRPSRTPMAVIARNA